MIGSRSVGRGSYSGRESVHALHRVVTGDRPQVFALGGMDGLVSRVTRREMHPADARHYSPVV